jgi:hypothetical protein
MTLTEKRDSHASNVGGCSPSTARDRAASPVSLSDATDIDSSPILTRCHGRTYYDRFDNESVDKYYTKHGPKTPCPALSFEFPHVALLHLPTK